MNRSPDDIFAAQFWAWPDPALKRDAHGRVLFVNAAFLHLFGGSVDAWRGQVVQGWSAPQPGPAPSRFEIRTPAADGYPEQIYDWLESCGADGTAFALARNVTAFAETQPVTPQPIDAAPVYDATQAAAQPVAMAAAAPDPTPVVAPPPAEMLDPTSFAAAAPEPAPQVAPQAAPVEIVPAPPLAAPHASLETVTPQAAPAPAPAAAQAPAPHASIEEPVRDFERRALPIENDEAVLGNNWRDAVIAKAIGGGEEADAPTLQRGGEASHAQKPGAIRILLAEDNAINALLTRTLLEADGHTVETVEDGLLAVEAMKTQNYDMIFMDMRMPNMDGLEATRKIRGLPNVSKDLPIVALTANAFDDDRNACFDSGMNDFMTKPVSAEELSEMVVRWTGAEEEQRMAS